MRKIENEVRPTQTKWGIKGKAFCERPFALHYQQPEKDKQSFDIAPSGKISADAHGCTDFNLMRTVMDALISI